MNIESYGFRLTDIPEHAKGIPARVTAVHRDLYEIVCDMGTGLARLQTGNYYAGKEIVPAAGDFVMLNWQEHGESRILQTLPRKTFFSRIDPSSSGYGEQAVAANFDYVFIMQAMDRDFNPRRLERYLTLSWQSGAVPVVILTKSDCQDDTDTYILSAEKVAVGVDVIAVSAKTGSGIDRLDQYLKPGRTIVLLGSSGVGKSTLVNALAGEDRMTTKSIRKKDGRGRHTTSHRQLLLLDSGVMIIDTPGMRELGMWDVSEGLGQSFTDVEQYFGQCKFSDCRHQGEPGCAVAGAIRSGELSPERWESYLKLCTEARYADDKTAYLREKQKRFKEISKLVRTMKETDYRHAPCTETFTCQVCGALIVPEDAGSSHRNHCPHCLSSIHADNKPGDRASLCRGIMEPIAVWVRKNGEWAIIHRCQSCGTLSSNRIAADDDASMLMSMAMKPLATHHQPGKPENIKEDAVTDKPGGSQESFTCTLCGKTAEIKESGRSRNHCPHCLTSIHTDNRPGDKSSLCKGTMDPIAIWVREGDEWQIIHRCRSCGTLRTSYISADDNDALLKSVAMKPLAAPPFPLWQLES